jgi:small subunit ribosomal protein S3
MGQKVNPIGFRVGVNRKWRSNWYSAKLGPLFIKEDRDIRGVVTKRYRGAGLADIYIERPSEANVSLTIRTARPGIIIGKGGAEIDNFQKDLEKRFKRTFRISIQEVENPDTEASLIAEDLAYRISNRTPPMRAIKEVISRSMGTGVQGIKVACAGRLGGAEIARGVWQKAGRVPLHTIRADIDYGFKEAWTKTGHIGIKVWLFRGEHVKLPSLESAAEESAGSNGADAVAEAVAEGLVAAPEAAAPETPAAEPTATAEPTTATDAAPDVAAKPETPEVKPEGGDDAAATS